MNRRSFIRLAATAGTLPVMLRTSPLVAVGSRPETFKSKADWDAVYEHFWGPLASHTRSQIEKMVHARNGVYDDTEGPFAWIVHYWLRAWAQMADWTGDEKYLHAGISLIDYMFDHTDEKRIDRGEIREAYVREPGGFQATGKGGPFWMRRKEAIILNTAQTVHGIMRFVDRILENEARWPAYALIARNHMKLAARALDVFDSDWKKFGDAGSYFYRDSGGTNVLGNTPAAFNQSATACAAHLLIDKWDPNPARREKARRLARYWLNEYADFRPDGTVVWPYIIHPDFPEVEDTGHASVDLDFLVLAHELGIAEIGKAEIAALAETFARNIWNKDGSLNELVDGGSETGAAFDGHYNAGFGWFALANHYPDIITMALQTYRRFYPANAPGGVLWARPMLGWANLLPHLDQ